MNIDRALVCPKCTGRCFEVKREATYVYTYMVNTPVMENLSENREGLSFLFDRREKTNSKEYLLCLGCGSKYPCSLEEHDDTVKFTILQKAIRADNVVNPGYLG